MDQLNWFQIRVTTGVEVKFFDLFRFRKKIVNMENRISTLNDLKILIEFSSIENFGPK